MDIVVVLGAQNEVDGTLSPMALARAEGALAEYRRHPGAMVLVTGGYGDFNRGEKPHAHYLAGHLLRIGLLPQDLLPLAVSANTVEDAVIVRSIIDGYPWDTLRVVTSEHHLERAQTIFEHFFPPARLVMVDTPMAVQVSRVAGYLNHEYMANERIRRQGGIYVGDQLVEGYASCPSTSTLMKSLTRLAGAEESLVSVYR